MYLSSENILRVLGPTQPYMYRVMSALNWGEG